MDDLSTHVPLMQLVYGILRPEERDNIVDRTEMYLENRSIVRESFVTTIILVVISSLIDSFIDSISRLVHESLTDVE